MLFIDKITARIPGLFCAEKYGKLIPTRRILENLAPISPKGTAVKLDFIERHLGINTIALTQQTCEFLEKNIWAMKNDIDFQRFENNYRLTERQVVNHSLINMLRECLDEILPVDHDERKKIKRHIHISLGPPADMDQCMGELRREFDLPEYMATETVSMACPSLPLILMNLKRQSVAEECFYLITGDNNMLAFAQQYARLAKNEVTDINRWLYVAAFGEATGAALIRATPNNIQAERVHAWEILSAEVERLPGTKKENWRGIIAPDGTMEINVKEVATTYRQAMQKQVPLSLRAIETKNRSDAIPLLHAYGFHESNFHLSVEMAKEHNIPENLVARFCDRTGSLIGMSAFVLLSNALSSWRKQWAERSDIPKNNVAVSIVGQGGIDIACGHIVIQATEALQEKFNLKHRQLQQQSETI